MASVFRKVLLLTGGIIVNAVAGNLNNWGTFLPYIASYFYMKDHSIQSSDLALVPSIGYIAESVFTLAISYLTLYLSIFNIILICSAFFCAGMFFSSFIEDPQMFSWVYGLSIGSLSASVFLPSLWIIWNRIPEKKPLLSGILLSGYSLGSVPFGLMFTLIVNPHNRSAESTAGGEKMFPREVAERVPNTIRWVSATFFICMCAGLVLLPRKGKVMTQEAGNSKSSSFKEILKNKRFWVLFFMMYLAVTCQGYVHFYYKVIAIQFINDDYYSAYVGMIAFFLAGIGRSLFGYLFQRMYWKKVMCLVYFLETLLMGGMWFAVSDKSLYAFFMISYHFLTSSFYNNILNLTEQAFPGDKKMISCVCMSFIPSNFSPYILSKFLEPQIKMYGCFIIIAFLTLVLFFCSVFYKEPKKEEQLI